MARICIVPRVHGIGGMVSFQHKLAAGLEARGIDTCFCLDETPYDAVLITGGTRDLPGLWRARRRGVRLVQRLDGINWIHRRRRTGLRHFIRAEYGNRVLAAIRIRFATHIVYQSEFVRGWWEDWYGPTPVPCSVIHNGVDLRAYSPATEVATTDKYRLLVVEGSMGGGYEMGLDWAIRLAELLAERHGFPMELMIVGRVSPKQQAALRTRSRVPLLWAGLVPREHIPELDRSAHLLFSADLNTACPNAVIEALACGLPVVGFDTGALAEVVGGEAGHIVPYGGDPWKIDPPDLPALAAAAAEILPDQPCFRIAARARAVEAFSLETMVDRYLDVLLGT